MGFWALSMSDGSVAIMQTVGDATPEDCIAKWPQGERQKVVTFREVARDSIPSDRSFRNAWTWNADRTRLEHDMDKARAIHRDRLRAERAPRLVALDVQAIRAQETAAPLGDVVAQKQTLRDVTDDPRIDAAQTVEELKALTLDVLTSA